MKKYMLLFIIPVSCICNLQAQFFLGLRGSQYGGVTNVDYNPAIANSPFFIDINLIAAAATINNNYVGLDRQVILHPVLFNSANFQQDFLHERVNGRDKNAYAGAQLTGPLSFMFQFGRKGHKRQNAIAFTCHANLVANAENVNETLARIAYYGLGTNAQAATNFLGQSLSNANLGLKAAAWNDYGITYSRVILDKGENLIKVGGTLKLEQPLAGAYAQLNNLNYKWPEYDLLSINRTSVSYAYSEGLITSKGYSASAIAQNLPGYLGNVFNTKYAVPTVAADMGAVYEWHPDHEKYSPDYNCDCQSLKDRDRYKLAVGFSIMDFGALRFKRGDYSQNFYANINNWEVAGDKFPNGLQSLDDTIRARFQILPTKSTFTLWLPTRFNIFIDYNIYKEFGVTVATMVSPDMSPTQNMLTQVTTFSVTPKYDNRWIGVYLPLSYDVYGNFSMGATLRLGPLTIGTQDLLGLFAKKYVYNADIHASLKITIPYNGICKKGDVRFMKKAPIDFG